MFRERFYRDAMGQGRFVAVQAAVETSDLWVGLSPETDTARAAELLPGLIAQARAQVEAWASAHPEFLSSLEPLPAEPDAPPVVAAMLEAGQAAGVGPMAAVAGAIAEAVGRGLVELLAPREIVVENGGDLWISCAQPLVLGLYAGRSSLSGKIGMEIPAASFPLGVCTSSSTVGPSLSLGRADAAMVACRSAALADAWATALGNRIRTEADLEPAAEACVKEEGILSCLAVKAGTAAAAGAFRILPL